MKIPINNLFVAQTNLKRKEQIGDIIESIRNNEYIEPIKISEIDQDNQKYRVEDGTHRSVAYFLSGRKYLEDGEYQIVPVNPSRATSINIKELASRILGEWDNP